MVPLCCLEKRVDDDVHKLYMDTLHLLTYSKTSKKGKFLTVTLFSITEGMPLGPYKGRNRTL
jgi:hypothetical protein